MSQILHYLDLCEISVLLLFYIIINYFLFYRNQIPFTPTQVEAIRAGMQPGLTLVVGPPGTGKTDVAVQIISNLYHNFPNQRTLIVTHSNQALNQLFEKIMALDIDERHLLRLGHGEEALETEKDFSRYGRVNYVLAKRMMLLEEVQRLKVCDSLLDVKRLKKIRTEGLEKIEHFCLPTHNFASQKLYLFLSLCLVISIFSYPLVYPPTEVVSIFFYPSISILTTK